jgi:GT2 family glycosyltransferase
MLEDTRIGEDYFDAQFFMYADDTDLGWRARLRGWKTIYAPNANVYHMHSASSDSYSPLKAFLVERNRIWVMFTYFPFGVIIRGQLFTLCRYIFQVYGAFTGRGASGGFTRSHSKMALVKVLFRVWAGALGGLSGVRAKRMMVQKRRAIGRDEIVAVLKRYGVSAKDIGLKG